ncbi:hypothetical protein [Stomatohabitans albus]|uniref:hypothetical protein n=1 Tax=Stomatohabitans albus TaxID=3110766 RepID=UPI00300D6645
MFSSPTQRLSIAIGLFALTACSTNATGTPEQSSETGGGDDSDTAELHTPLTAFDVNAIEPDGATSVDGQVIKDISTFALPIDPYIPPRTGSKDKVRQIYLSNCLQEKHVATSLPPIEYNFNRPPNPMVSKSYGLFLFTPENASTYGYFSGYNSEIDENYKQFNKTINTIRSIAEKEEEVPGRENVFEVVVDEQNINDPSYMALQECEQTIDQDLPFLRAQMDTAHNAQSDDERIEYDASQAYLLYGDAQPPLLVETQKVWKECMKPLGIPDLPDNPLEMPSNSLIMKWFGEREPDFSQRSTPSPEELTVATHDAQCRQTSGFYRTYYDVQWGYLQEYVRKNRDSIQQTKQQEDDAERARRAYISQHQ